MEVKYIPAEVTEKLQGTPFFEVVEQMPEYPGGMAAALEYIQKNMRYPETAKKNGTQGRVTVQFIIDKGGNVTDPKVIRAVDKDLDAEAIRLIGNDAEVETRYAERTSGSSEVYTAGNVQTGRGRDEKFSYCRDEQTPWKFIG